MGAEAIRSAIHVILPSLRSSCDTVYYPDERALFLLHLWPFLAIYSFKHTNNIRYWWFFLPQGNQWTKYLAHPKIREPKLCLLMFASLLALDGFHPLLSTQLTADLTLEWSWRSMFQPLTHTYAKTFCCYEKLQTTLWIFDALLFLINSEQTRNPLWTQLSHCKIVNIVPTDTFNPSAISRNFNLRLAKTSACRFWYFPGQLPNLGDLSVQHHLRLYDRV